MKLVKPLNIKGIVLDKHQLEDYLEKIASDHILQNYSDKNTYPIPKLEENFKSITKTYDLLNSHLKMGINIHPAGEWLLDNYYIIEEEVKAITKELPLKKYVNFLGIANGSYKGYARIYILASEIVAYTDGRIDSSNIPDYIKSYQNKKTLNMEEIWDINIFFKIALIENIAMVCEKIYWSQKQKYKVENILERLVENKTKNEQVFKMTQEYKHEVINSGEIKYPFIEYMSYRLKKYGRESIGFLNVLEEQVNKMGTTVEEVIKKEHFDIAVKKVLIGNCIKSIKDLQRINFLEIFEEINGVEEILKKDPAGVYDRMDYKTKTYYRNEIKELSKKTKISEIYIAKKALELSQKASQVEEKEKLQQKKTHIGYYLISDGKKHLIDSLQATVKTIFKLKTKQAKAKQYIWSILLLTFVISLLFGIHMYHATSNLFLSIVTFLILLIPVSEITIQIIQYVLNKIVKPKLIPKLDLSSGIPEELTTMVIIPTIVKDVDKVKQLFSKLEVYYLANKSENLYFTLLGDCSSSNREKEDFDTEVINAGREEIKRLNQKYNQQGLGKFQFIYRKRKWNEKEKSYLGWERKRGFINQFNEFLLGKKQTDFLVNTIEEYQQETTDNSNIPKIKYIITLDGDTDLVLNSGLELIGAMAHILNTPILNENKSVVVDGHGMMQPRVGIDLEIVQMSLFTKIFAGSGGTDSYTNAISDTYQDNFGEGIFTGKGVYDLQIFETVLNHQIPENTVLSHDLLEGNYLRCGLVSDILLMDGFPYKYNSFITRLHRWIRGDWQIIGWLKKTVKNKAGITVENPLNMISKFKILDNLRRSLLEIFLVFSLFLFTMIGITSQVTIWPFITILIITTLMPTLLDYLNYIIFRKEGMKKQKTFENTISILQGSFLRGVIGLSFLPHKAYISLNAIIKTMYRMTVTKQNLLEWTTSEEAEHILKTSLKSFYIQMFPNIILGVILFVLVISYIKAPICIFGLLLAVLWLVGPIIAWYISKQNKNRDKLAELSKEKVDYILDIGKRTWEYFNTYMNKENNFLPPDNYQEDRNNKIVNRTSSTNIGLGLLAIISAFDLGYIEEKQCMGLLEKSIETIMKLPKWNGHLYNWYHTKTLQPLIPRYISSVDSGNFVGYLYTLRQFLEDRKEKGDNINFLLSQINQLIENTDFSILYSEEKGLFSIGFDVEANKLTDTYYDLLASEARQASFVAIAKRDIPSKHWSNLSRTLTILDKYKGLISWSGTAFEYLMPNINIKRYPGSLLDESCKFMIMSQEKYAKKLGTPWGISESAFNLKDLNYNYQYKAFGIPWLGLKRGLAEERVISSYGSILAITDEPNKVIENLKLLEKENMYGQYGFYESIDYTPARLPYGKKSVPVRTYMAHHQALILLSINNLINHNVLQERFMNNPETKAINILLEERMPENVIITKERKEKVEKVKYDGYDNYAERIYTKLNSNIQNSNVISNEDYCVCMNEKGEGFSKYKNIMVNRYKETNDYAQGIFFYIKNIKSKKIWTSSYNTSVTKPDKYTIHFMPDINKIVRNDENIETTVKVITAPGEPVEIRSIELKNHGNTEEILEVTGVFEPVLSDKNQDYAHMAFNNLFLKYEILDDTKSILIKRNKRGDINPIYLGTNFYTESETIGDFEYEIDKEKLYEKGNTIIPKMIENSLPFSKTIGLVTDPVVALKRTVKIQPGQSAKLNLVIGVSEEKEKVAKLLAEYQNTENIKRVFDLSKAKVEEEARYLGIKGQDIINYQKMLSFLIFQNPMKKTYMYQLPKKEYKQQDLWKYGISGDIPILLVKIKDTNDIGVIQECLKAYEYFKIKNIDIELVILDEEENSYEQYVKEAIMEEILNRNLGYLENIYGGIFILNKNDIQDDGLLEFVSNLWIEADRGDIKTILKDKEEEYLETIKNIGLDKSEQRILPEFNNIHPDIPFQDLKYYNGYGAFSDDGSEYIIKINKHHTLPTTWSHILANENFGTLVTQNMGGFTWSKNSRLNRITAWSNNPLFDIPSEIIYLKDTNLGISWSLGQNPMPDDNDYYITYGFGYAKYYHTSLGIVQELETFVPRQDNIKVNLLKLKNTTPNKKNLKLVYYLKPVLRRR